ncbi:MAG TPA: cardiolipin synthase ClsB [Candidatus Pseudomonas excrementavium]|uniref:cardiolipin synthase ClsB n=1 Tax=Halopseudomonas bauzanensis TaxID=653930 RepID=UPI001C3AFCF1|nr:cardiolipin synthase ClsB [Halopseudomonas bauzanensis]HIZ51329.1 cardiolipin synthase ClsB [Candidatus Pseudomonas excrementavium]
MRPVWREGNDAELLINGEEFFPRVFERIRNARKEVLLETFIILEDKVGKELQRALISAANNGAHVEVIVDGYGTVDLSNGYIGEMIEAGIRVHTFDPQPKLMGMRTNLFRRLHRKIVVVDSEVAYVGGINFTAVHLGDYGPGAKQDYAVEVRGPIVSDIRHASLNLFRHARRELPLPLNPEDRARTRHAGSAWIMLAIRDNNHHTADIEDQYLRAIRSANHRLVIANAYFFPGYRMLRELRNAARRGVHVTLILQGEPDMPWVRHCSTFLYSYLLRSGVVIHEYCKRPLHGKVALMDREWVTVGSSNLDPLSLSLNLEGNLFIRDPQLNQRLYNHLQSLANKHCDEITAARATRGFWWRAPMTFLFFHFLRHFPAIAGSLPAHTPRLEPLLPQEEPAEEELATLEQEKLL